MKCRFCNRFATAPQNKTRTASATQAQLTLREGDSSNMKLTVFIVALDVVEESTEASRQGCFQLHPAHRGAHPLSGLVGADFIVLSLPHTGAQ